MVYNPSIARTLSIEYNARTAVVGVRMENVILTLLLLSLPIWLCARNPRVKVLKIFGLWFYNPSITMDLSIEYNARTMVVRLRMGNPFLTSLLLRFWIWVYGRKVGIEVSESLVLCSTIQV